VSEPGAARFRLTEDLTLPRTVGESVLSHDVVL